MMALAVESGASATNVLTMLAGVRLTVERLS